MDAASRPLWERDAAGVLHVVALSGGKDSTALALRLAETEPRPYCFVCTPTGDELPELFDHWNELSAKLGRRIVPVMASAGLDALIESEKSLPSRRMRWCTRKLKIVPYRLWLQARSAESPVVSYVGLRADELGRAGGAFDDIAGVSMRFPLREWGWKEADVLAFLEQRGQRIPDRTDCAKCFYQTLGEWWRLWRDHPEIFEKAVQQEKTTGHSFRTPRLDPEGAPIMVSRYGRTFVSCWRDTWPAHLADLRLLFEDGRIPMFAKRQTDLFRGSGGCRVCTM